MPQNVVADITGTDLLITQPDDITVLTSQSRFWSGSEKSDEQNGVAEHERDTIGLGRKVLKLRKLRRKRLILRALHRVGVMASVWFPKP